ncbi:esterase/lipase family protein [Parahaliea mediterranea]|uniref:esterase/lipase family protein n=1 Tax=Parahaliea mediterranea TaxID=651086 RepID=UPI0019D46878|nr:alpha/beta hydrolase [Parahaliea mediterranea]
MRLRLDCQWWRLLAGCFALLLVPPAAAEPAPASADCVVLLHGLGRTGLSMLDMSWALQRAGYRVENISYPSLFYPIEQVADIALEAGLAGCRSRSPGSGIARGNDTARHNSAPRIHIVTHSLGGILVRQYLQQHVIAELGRVVMLGPPNQGSTLADYVYSFSWLHWLAPPAIEQLGTGIASVPRHLGPVQFELGVIAGTLRWRLPLPGAPPLPSDGTVAVSETRVAGMTDFIAMPASHTFMMWNAGVQAQVMHFLRYGRFAIE